MFLFSIRKTSQQKCPFSFRLGITTKELETLINNINYYLGPGVNRIQNSLLVNQKKEFDQCALETREKFVGKLGRRLGA